MMPELHRVVMTHHVRPPSGAPQGGNWDAHGKPMEITALFLAQNADAAEVIGQKRGGLHAILCLGGGGLLILILVRDRAADAVAARAQPSPGARRAPRVHLAINHRVRFIVLLVGGGGGVSAKSARQAHCAAAAPRQKVNLLVIVRKLAGIEEGAHAHRVAVVAIACQVANVGRGCRQRAPHASGASGLAKGK